MPANKTTNGVAPTQSTTTSQRFELPALELKFGSLTDGTDIPPPLPSPKEEHPPLQPRVVAKIEEKVEGQQVKTEANGATNGSTTGQGMSRPPSRTASLLAEEKKSKRSSGWFRRLRSHDNNANNDKPATLQIEALNKKPTGPPPPMIPELSALETKIDTHLGDDLFKGIGRDL